MYWKQSSQYETVLTLTRRDIMYIQASINDGSRELSLRNV